MVFNALISVTDKQYLDQFANGLIKRRFVLYATGSTYQYLLDKDIDVININQLTNLKYDLDGRVKTLHHAIFTALLADKRNNKHLDILSKHIFFDLVIVNFYDFNKAIQDRSSNVIDAIDIGGPAMVRAASKNYHNITVITDPNEYLDTLHIIDSNQWDKEPFRYKQACKAFSYVSSYDLTISNYFNSGNSESDNDLYLRYIHLSQLRYGENPHQDADVYRECGKKFPFSVIHGKEMSYNNYLDLHHGIIAINQFDDPTVIILKHNTPCGISSDIDIYQAYKKAYMCDSLSAYGGILITNVALDSFIIKSMLDMNYFEIIAAPTLNGQFDDIKPSVRLVEYDCDLSDMDKIYRFITNGLLVQNPMPKLSTRSIDKWDVVTNNKLKLNNQMINNLLFGWRTVRTLKSNSVAIVSNMQTIGLGSGEVSRVSASRNAIYRMQDNKFNVDDNTIAVSDGFFPFTDGIELLLDVNIKIIVQPGGSIRDNLIIDHVNQNNGVMYFTNERAFVH